jgi:hypothetical protein
VARRNWRFYYVGSFTRYVFHFCEQSDGIHRINLFIAATKPSTRGYRKQILQFLLAMLVLTAGLEYELLKLSIAGKDVFPTYTMAMWVRSMSSYWG